MTFNISDKIIHYFVVYEIIETIDKCLFYVPGAANRPQAETGLVSHPKSARCVSTLLTLYQRIILKMKLIHKEIDKDGRG